MKTRTLACALAVLLSTLLGFHARGDVPLENLWSNPSFEEGDNLDDPTGTPSGWARGGSNPTLCEVTTEASESPTHSLIVNDTDNQGYAEWYANLNITDLFTAGETLNLHWHEMYNISGGEMRVSVLFFSANNTLLAQNHFVVRGSSSGWAGDVASSTFTIRREQVTVPATSTRLQISLVSGGALSTTGVMIIDDLSVTKPRQPVLLPGNFWVNSTFESGQDLDEPTGTPTGWKRGGSDPSINQATTENSISPTHALAVVDADAANYGEWYADLGLGGHANPGDALDLQWFQVFNISGGEMRLSVLFFDADETVVGQNHYVVKGQSEGWAGSVSASPMVKRNERITVPEGAVKTRISLVSGGPAETLGTLVVDDISVAKVPNTLLAGNIWPNSTFEEGIALDQPTGTPTTWNRGGSDTSIDQVTHDAANSPTHALVVVDNNVAGYGEWYANLDLTGLTTIGDTLKLQWYEAFNVAPGGEMRLSVLFWNASDELLDQIHFVAKGQSAGWNSTLASSSFNRRAERVVVPNGAHRLQISLVSGGPSETTGVMAIDDLSFAVLPPGIVLQNNFWPNPTFEDGTDLDDPSNGLPAGWGRGGSDGKICQVSTAKSTSGSHSLALVDDSDTGYGEWDQTLSLTGKALPGDILQLQWFEVFNTSGEMRLTVLFFKQGGALTAQKHFLIKGQSAGWAGTLGSSPFVHRLEKLTIPDETTSMLVALVSGGPLNAKGVVLIDDLSVRVYNPDFDSDGDGASDGAEEIAGTDPANPNSVLKITQLTSIAGVAKLEWLSVPGKTYAIRYSPTVDGDYIPLTDGENIPAAEGATTTTFDIPVSLGNKTGFYVIQIVEAPNAF